MLHVMEIARFALLPDGISENYSDAPQSVFSNIEIVKYAFEAIVPV